MCKKISKRCYNLNGSAILHRMTNATKTFEHQPYRTYSTFDTAETAVLVINYHKLLKKSLQETLNYMQMMPKKSYSSHFHSKYASL